MSKRSHGEPKTVSNRDTYDSEKNQIPGRIYRQLIMGLRQMGSSGSPGTVFTTTNNLRIARRTTHYTTIHCDRCQRWFPHERAYEQHTEDSCSHWIYDEEGKETADDHETGVV
jgi:hypothetical protein